jgi:xanthine dehydrogenase molybdopterin-binding subunit B
MGQGLHTKVAQVVSHALGRIFNAPGKYVALDKIRIADYSSVPDLSLSP